MFNGNIDVGRPCSRFEKLLIIPPTSNGSIVAKYFVIASAMSMCCGAYFFMRGFWDENPKVDIMATVFYGLSIGLLTVGFSLCLIFLPTLNDIIMGGEVNIVDIIIRLLNPFPILVLYFLNIIGFLFSVLGLDKLLAVKDIKRIVCIFFVSIIIIGMFIIVGLGVIGKNFEKERERVVTSPDRFECLSEYDRRSIPANSVENFDYWGER